MRIDEINFWSEVKLEIVREYAAAYSTILSAQKNPSFDHFYIDAFAGAGVHLSKKTGSFVAGSPMNALLIKPPFKEYFFVELDSVKVASLHKLAEKEKRIHLYSGDCNQLLTENIFPKVKWENYKRALCLLDPYGLHLDWRILETAGKMKSVEIFFNFSIMDANMNIFHHDPSSVDTEQIDRMNKCWGDNSWRKIVYDTSGNLFGFEEKTNNQNIIKAFQKRLKNVAGFKYVPDPIPMKNSKGATVYYLFFAAHKPAAQDIVKQIFQKYKKKG